MYRKSGNLRDILITGLVNQKEPQMQHCMPCRDLRNKQCLTCDRITYGNTNTSPDNVTLKIRRKFNCQSQNCVYCLTYNCFGKKYIRESSQIINQHMRGHDSQIRYYQKHTGNPVAQYFGINKLTEKQYTLEIINQEQDKNRIDWKKPEFFS